MTKKLVNDIRILKSLEENGFIKFHKDTGNKVYWNGQYFRTYYIDDYLNSSNFEFKGIKYSVEYRDGCFYPFVFIVNY